MERTIAQYEEYMEQMASTVIRVTEKVGLIVAIQLPYELDPQRLMNIGGRAMAAATKQKLQYIIIDFSNIETLRWSHNIMGVVGITQAFRIIGMEVLVTGISPPVAKAVVDAGYKLDNIRIFGTVADALKEIHVN